jgi:hypothetical protein
LADSCDDWGTRFLIDRNDTSQRLLRPKAQAIEFAAR